MMMSTVQPPHLHPIPQASSHGLQVNGHHIESPSYKTIADLRRFTVTDLSGIAEESESAYLWTR